MPFLVVIIAVSMSLVAHAAGSQSLTVEHSSDVIVYLWWALGILATFAVFISSGTAVWMLQKVLKHDNDIAVIKARCELHTEEEEAS